MALASPTLSPGPPLGICPACRGVRHDQCAGPAACNCRQCCARAVIARATSVWASPAASPAQLRQQLARVLSLEAQRRIRADKIRLSAPGPREQRCACGCGARVVSKRYGRTRRFVDHAHGERARRARLAARVAAGVGTDAAPSGTAEPGSKARRFGWSDRTGWPDEASFARFLAS
jgi:hypothetical protein